MHEIIAIPGFSEPVSSISHLFAALVAAFGGIALAARGRGNSLRMLSLMIYTFSLTFLLTMSGVFHLLEPSGLARVVLQRLDHAGIYVLIAGSFTAIHTVFFIGWRRWLFIGFIWVIAITGLVLTTVYFESLDDSLRVSFYLGSGWVGIASGLLLYRSYGWKPVLFLFGGGVSYSIGALLMYFEWPVLIPGVVGAHELFHFWVIVGALLHWLLVYRWAGNPLSTRLTFDVRHRKNGRIYAHARTEYCSVQGGSIDDVKDSIASYIDKHYHCSMRPVSIRLKEAHEDVFVL